MYSINGSIFNTKDINISIQNRGLNYGDGVFETIRIKNKRILFEEDHFNRLNNACNATFLKINPTQVKNWIHDIIKVNDIINGVLKINIIRKDGGLFSPITNEVDTIIRVRETSTHTENKLNNVGLYTQFEKSYSSTSRFKTNNCIEYIKAGIHKLENNFDDLVLVNQNKEIVECLYSNITWIKDGQWSSPSIKTGCIEGIMLKQIQKELHEKGIKINFGEYTVDELLDADFIFNSNINGIKVIKKIQSKKFSGHSEIIEQIINRFK